MSRWIPIKVAHEASPRPTPTRLSPKFPPSSRWPGTGKDEISMGINCVKMHPEFNQMASASDDASIKLWDLDSGKFEASLKGHTAAVNHIAIDPTGRFIAVIYPNFFQNII